MMFSFAVATLRHRKAGFAGAFVALFCAAALVCGCGTLLATGLLGGVRPERYAAAPIVVAGDQNVHQVQNKGKGKVKEKAKPIMRPGLGARRARRPDRGAALGAVRQHRGDVPGAAARRPHGELLGPRLGVRAAGRPDPGLGGRAVGRRRGRAGRRRRPPGPTSPSAPPCGPAPPGRR